MAWPFDLPDPPDPAWPAAVPVHPRPV